MKIGDNETNIYEYGHGDNLVIAFPSFPHSGKIFELLLPYIDTSKNKLVSFDIPGWAGTIKSSHLNRATTVKDLNEFLNNLVNKYQFKKINFLGYSFGCFYLLNYLVNRKFEYDTATFVSPFIFGASISHKRVLIELVYRLKLVKFFERSIVSRFDISTEDISDTKILQYKDNYFVNINYKKALYDVRYLLGYEFSKETYDNINFRVIAQSSDNHNFGEEIVRLKQKVSSFNLEYIDGDHNSFVLEPSKEKLKKTCVFSY